MRVLLCLLAAVLVCGSAQAENAMQDCLGVVRSYGDAASWFSSAVVVGDGSWVVTSWDAVTEKVGPNTSQTVRNPMFISAYTGQAWQCEVKASNKDLNIAILKLPTKGLPAAPLAQMSDFAKAAYHTMGEMMSGDPIGNKWPTEIMGISREKVGDAYKLVPSSWNADKVFVTDMGKFKWTFLIDVSPNKPVSNGAVVSRGSTMIGLYLNKLVITSGDQKQVFGRCAMATEIAKYAGDKLGIGTSELYNPPAPTIKRGPSADAVFQLQAKLYTAVTAGRPDSALESSKAIMNALPDDLQARMMYGAALTGTGKFEDAIKIFDEISKIDPKYPGLKVNHALALIGLKKSAEAEAELLKAVEEAPSDTRPVIALADYYFASESTLDKSLTYATKAASLAPDSPAARLLVGKVQKRLKNIQASVNEIGEAIKMAPDWGEAWFALGATFEEGGDKVNAEKAYRKLVEKQPKNPSSIMTLASFLVDQGKKDEPLELIARIRALTPAPPKEVLDAAKALEEKVKK